jgi:hypothetical protein
MEEEVEWINAGLSQKGDPRLILVDEMREWMLALYSNYKCTSSFKTFDAFLAQQCVDINTPTFIGHVTPVMDEEEGVDHFNQQMGLMDEWQTERLKHFKMCYNNAAHKKEKNLFFEAKGMEEWDDVTKSVYASNKKKYEEAKQWVVSAYEENEEEKFCASIFL